MSQKAQIDPPQDQAAPNSHDSPPIRRYFQEPKRNPLARALHRLRNRRHTSARTMLPLLIKVFAGFSKLDGRIVEDDIDSSLGFLRHDYPEALYSELRDLYQQALSEPQDLNETAQELASRLSIEDKVLLGVQLYVLISRAKFQKQQLLSFYLFMTNLGVASEAIDIVYQLNTSELSNANPEKELSQPLESLLISGTRPADVRLDSLPAGCAIAAFRFQSLVLIKNIGTSTVIARGRQIAPGEFCRLFEGQRILLIDLVLDYQDLVFYLNAKKNVSSTRLYLAFSSGGSPYIEKTQTRDSFLEIIFGLNIVVRALRDTDAQINGRPLPRSTEIEVSLGDRITFADKSQVSMAELRRRARELGGSFDLTTSRTEYLVSNDPIKLREGDILLSSGTTGKLLLKIRCDYAERTGELEVIEADRPLFVRGVQVRDHATLDDGETITIGEGQYLRCDFSDRTIEEERNIISRLEIKDLSHRYTSRTTALESISLSARRGELICVMGPSGCGKSTLLRALAGHLKPKEGQVLLNGFSLFEHTDSLTPFISYIPHEEAYDSLLTVGENISTASAIRSPHLSLSDRANRVENKLTELGLYQLRNRLAGEPEDKFLSGGERKRLNVGLDMIAISDVFLIDEPTSGLSSKDSEHVIEIIRGLAHNKIIFVSIHQPSARLFGMFNKALLLDKSGKMAFFGTPDEMLDYFHDAHVEEVGRPPESSSTIGSNDNSEVDQDGYSWRQPDLIFDVLETPLRDLGGDIIYEEDSRGHTAPARRFSPDFWRDRFQAHRIVQDATKTSDKTVSEELNDAAPADSAGVIASPQKLPNPPVRRGRESIVQFVALLYRAVRSKLRNRANLVTTLLEAPLLAALVATVLRYSEDGTYTFAAAFHIPAYLFLTLVVGMFLGLTNSADEIIRDRALLQRERNQNVSVVHYIASKFIALSVFAVLQCVVYLLIANAILEVRGMFWNHLGWMLLTQLNGVAIGLLISSFVRDSKTALNWIPVVLIPQIILGGALIKYEEMNRNLDFVFSIRQWLQEESDTGTAEPPSRLKVPTICQFMPLRWSYESIVISQANHNPIAEALAAINATVDELKVKPELDRSERQLFDRAKQALALIAGLEADQPHQLRRMLRRIHQQLDDRYINLKKFPIPDSEDPVSADELYINQKIRDLVDKAEMERTDYRDAREQNVFFGTQRTFTKPAFLRNATATADQESPPDPADDVFVIRTLNLNRLVLVLFIAISLTVLYATLRRKLTKFA